MLFMQDAHERQHPVASEAIQRLLDRVPHENELRAELAKNLRDAALLRSLLRIAKRKALIAAASAAPAQGRDTRAK